MNMTIVCLLSSLSHCPHHGPETEATLVLLFKIVQNHNESNRIEWSYTQENTTVVCLALIYIRNSLTDDQLLVTNDSPYHPHI